MAVEMILVSGASGTVGSEVVRQLSSSTELMVLQRVECLRNNTNPRYKKVYDRIL